MSVIRKIFVIVSTFVFSYAVSSMLILVSWIFLGDWNYDSTGWGRLGILIIIILGIIVSMVSFIIQVLSSSGNSIARRAQTVYFLMSLVLTVSFLVVNSLTLFLSGQDTLGLNGTLFWLALYLYLIIYLGLSSIIFNTILSESANKILKRIYLVLLGVSMIYVIALLMVSK